MIRINGVPLDNPEMGWVFRPGSVPYSGFESDLPQFALVGRDGNVATPSTVRAPLWPLQVNVAPEGWEALQALFRVPVLVMTHDDRPGMEIGVRFASSSIDRIYPRNRWVDVTILVELSGAYWRSVTVSTFQTVNGTVTCWPSGSPAGAISAPVQDALVRVKGPSSSVQVYDSSSAWVTLPAANAGEWVRFEAGTGRCFLTTTDTWTGGTDISGRVDFGGPRSVFEITPVMLSSPSDRAGVLTVTGGTVTVRGRSAHAL